MRIMELPEDIAQGLGSRWKDLPLVPRWKASRLRHTGPMLLRPLSFADCAVSKPACKWTIF